MAEPRTNLPVPTPTSFAILGLLAIRPCTTYEIAKQIDPSFNVALQTFVAASGQTKLPAFENYIRGISATTPQERIKRQGLDNLATFQPVAGADKTFADSTGHFRERYGVRHAGAGYLLRPDQHVCARWLTLDASRLEAAFNRALPH